MSDGDVVLGYVVRIGDVRGAGKYARIDRGGCDCYACIKWVEDRDDATLYRHRARPRHIAKRDGGRVVRIVRRASPRRSTKR